MTDSPTVRDPTVLDPAQIERPDQQLLTYYIFSSFVVGPFFPALLVPRLFRYRSLRYRFDDQGVAMTWGILFRREIHLTYSRIQDIHLTSNVLERWLGLARIQIQTASGSSKPEMTIEGVLQFERLRDFLYARMRGIETDGENANGSDGDTAERTELPAGAARGALNAAAAAELAESLREVAAELRALRADRGQPRGPADD